MPHDDQNLPVLTDVIVAGLAWTPPSEPKPGAPPPSPATAALADAQQLLDELTVPWAQDPPAAPARTGAPALVETEFDLGQSFDAMASPFPAEAPPPGSVLAFPTPDARDDDAPALTDTPPPAPPEPPHAPQPDDSADADAGTGAIAQAGDAPHAPQPDDLAIAPPADAARMPPAAPAVDVAALEAALGAALDARLDAALRTLRVQLRADLHAQLRAALAPADPDPPT